MSGRVVTDSYHQNLKRIRWVDICTEMNIFDFRHVVVHALTDGENYRGYEEIMWALIHLKNVGDRVG